MGEKKTYYCFRCHNQFKVEMIKGPRGLGSIWRVEDQENKGSDPICLTPDCNGLLGVTQVWLGPRQEHAREIAARAKRSVE